MLTINVPIIKNCAITNWATVNVFLIHALRVWPEFAKAWFFSTSTGLKPDNTNAGYRPDKKLTVIISRAKNNKTPGWLSMLTCSPGGIKPANALSNNGVKTIDNKAAMMVIKHVSLKNWKTNCFLELPIVFLMPISFALWDACAVVRFIKFIQPSSNRKIAIASKPYMVGRWATR